MPWQTTLSPTHHHLNPTDNQMDENYNLESDNLKTKLISGRNWSPIAESNQQIDTSGNGTSSILLDFKSSEASSPG